MGYLASTLYTFPVNLTHKHQTISLLCKIEDEINSPFLGAGWEELEEQRACGMEDCAVLKHFKEKLCSSLFVHLILCIIKVKNSSFNFGRQCTLLVSILTVCFQNNWEIFLTKQVMHSATPPFHLPASSFLVSPIVIVTPLTVSCATAHI